MRVAVLTSSRADYSIYSPLLQKMKDDSFFDLSIIAFGTHVSRFHGYTVKSIKDDGFKQLEFLETLVLGDSNTAISNAIGNTIIRFSSFWNEKKNQIDLIICLGDRYEMFAAVSASLPFQIPIAHLHGGETTDGAIDNTFRHCLSHMANYHFTSTEMYRKKLLAMGMAADTVFNVGSLSLENLFSNKMLSISEFKTEFGVDLDKPTVLCTVHPETKGKVDNRKLAEIITATVEDITAKYQVLITMPNADAQSTIIRESFLELALRNNRVVCKESLGTQGYFSAMKHCSLLLGNTSSGIIESASLGKYVINIGNRQHGRARSSNVVDVGINKEYILNAIDQLKNLEYKGDNIYSKSGTSHSIMNVLKEVGFKSNVK
jgi:GDP/UDP-N,N'-diacetylbacillosamine 2-epimerase (hydrolysing)